MPEFEANDNRSYVTQAVLFFLLLLVNTLMLTKLPVRDISFVTLGVTHFIMLFMLGYVFARRMVWPRSFRLFYLGEFLFSALLSLIFLVNPTGQDGEMLTHMLLVLSFALAAVHIAWNERQLDAFAYISAGLILVILVQWLLTGMPMVRFQGLIRNPNIMGVLLSVLLFFPLVRLKHVSSGGRLFMIAGIASALLLIVASSTRSIMLLVITMIGARVILRLAKPLFSKLIYLVMGFNVVFLIVYGSLSRMSLFNSLNQWSGETFGKSLFSGRQDIWDKGIQYGLQKPLFGHKIGLVPKDFMADAHFVHVHNQYLQIFLESGLVGLACFLLLLFGIWKILLKRLDLVVVRWTACFFLGLLVYQDLEISFFSNMPSIGLLQWLILGVGMSVVLHQVPESNDGKRRKTRREKHQSARI